MSQQELLDPDLLGNDDNLNDLLAHSDGLANDDRAWPKMLADLIAVNVAELKEDGFEHNEAWRIAKRLIIRQSHFLGGGMVYLPRNDKLKKALRDANLYHDFNGHNHRALMKKYNLTQQSVYQICAEQRQLFIDKKQGKLF
ncbi:Mor transcription activator family protein [Colwellia psychrerythraea]|uniref:Mor transcription activator domain protein n=1 Tax=Colwellia psychrerythraea TaxID=28229 RepID=A0A099K8K2_COLPS|nr:Mor transcription activator family protein [Colwellia psychrerythraea]KGJ86422.1 Mor transcription activator domain protein [Colwellia psychrerythraea]